MLRQMQTSDLAAVAALDAACFPLSWSREQYERELQENAFAQLYVLQKQGEIIGFIDFWITFDTCQLVKLAISPKQRRQHYASTLMEHMIQIAGQAGCETISLEVRPSNTAAHRLYEAYGFIKVNVRKGYYQDNGEDADFLIKALGGNSL